MLCLSVLTITMAALVSAAPPPKKDKNQFTIRPISQQDKCLDVEPVAGESVGYALVKPCRKDRGRAVPSQTFQWETQAPDADPNTFVSELLRSSYQVDGAPGCLWTEAPEDSPYPGVVPSVAACPAKDSEEYEYFRWRKTDLQGLQIYRRRGIRPGLKMIELTRDDNNQTNTVGALKSFTGTDDMKWVFIKA